MSSPPDKLPDPDALTEQIPATPDPDYISPYEDSTGEVTNPFTESSTFADSDEYPAAHGGTQTPAEGTDASSEQPATPPSGAAPYTASDPEEPKSFSRTQKVIGGGCGVLLLFTIMAGCAALFGPDVDKSKDAPTSTEVVTSAHTTKVESSTMTTIPASEPIPEKPHDPEPVREDAECSDPNKLGIDEETHYVLICNEETKKWSVSVFPEGYVEPAGLGEVETP